jgi:hypothetical protein
MGGLVQSLILNNLTAGLAGLAGLIVMGTLLAGGGLLIRANFPRLWRLIVQAINLVPAAILAITGVFAIPLWWLMKRIVGALLKLFPADTAFVRALASFSQLFASRNALEQLLISGERRKVSEALWPEATYPDLYRAVPDDLIRPPYDDGRLIGGARLTWLADRHMTEEAVRSAVRVALTMAVLAFVVLTVWHFFGMYEVIKQVVTELKGGGVPVEQWPGQEPTKVPTGWVVTAGFVVGLQAFLRALGDLATFLPGTALVCLGLGLLAMLMLLHGWHRVKSAPYEWQSKDADVRWAFRTETRTLIRKTYRQQVLQATEYLRDLPCFFVGRACGILRARGDLAAPVSGQPLRLDQEALFQHLLVFGGAGEGKTTALLKPLIRQLLRHKEYGMYVCDAKGVLWNDVAAVARQERPNAELFVIGTGQNQFGVDVLAGLTPTQVAGTLRSVMTQLAGGQGSGDSFWPDMAANVLRNVLSIARAYSFTEHGKAAAARTSISPYSLWWAYQAVLRTEVLNEALGQVREWATKARELLQNANTSAADREQVRALAAHISTSEVYDSMAYLESTWRDMAKDTKSGIVANLTQLLDGFAGAPVLRERFACGPSARSISIAEALNGKIVLNALSSIEDGLPARIVTVLLKTNLYREARRREAAYRQGTNRTKPQDQPCMVVMDEVQEIVTADVASGLSDATFWNVARSTGVAGIFATQTVAGLYQAIGREAAGNFMQQARSKVFFRTEDRETVEYACWCAGKFERNRVYDDGHRESVEYRALIDGWDPFAPVDEAEAIQGGPRQFFRSARDLLSPERVGVRTAQAANAYAVDTRFVAGAGEAPAQVQAIQAAAWRAEDLEREYRKFGNDMADAVTPADLIHMGRWHAFAQVQRAGAVRQDIITVEHDFG